MGLTLTAAGLALIAVTGGTHTSALKYLTEAVHKGPRGIVSEWTLPP